MIGTKLLLYPLCLMVDLFLSWAILKMKEVSREKNVLHDRCSVNVMEEGWKKYKSWSTWGRGWSTWGRTGKCHPLGTTRLLHSWAHISCDYIRKTCIRPIQTRFRHGWERHSQVTTPEELLSVDSCMGRENYSSLEVWPLVDYPWSSARPYILLENIFY